MRHFATHQPAAFCLTCANLPQSRKRRRIAEGAKDSGSFLVAGLSSGGKPADGLLFIFLDAFAPGETEAKIEHGGGIPHVGGESEKPHRLLLIFIHPRANAFSGAIAVDSYSGQTHLREINQQRKCPY